MTSSLFSTHAHRHAVVVSAAKNWPKSAPVAHTLRPQIFGGRGVYGDLYSCHNMPDKLVRALKNATYMGSGLSSDVWDLNNGTVLKLTKEDAAIKICQFLKKQRTIGLPYVRELVHDIKRLGFRDDKKWKPSKISEPTYTAIIQEKYAPLEFNQWERIKNSILHLDLGEEPDRFGRGSDGEAARGQEGQDIAYQLALVSKRIKQKDPDHPLAHCAIAMSTLHHWLKSGMLASNAGLDIDHADNWGQDRNGLPVLIDPIYTVKRNPKHWRNDDLAYN